MFSNFYSVSYKYTGNLGERINAFAFNLGLYFLSLFLSQKKAKRKKEKKPNTCTYSTALSTEMFQIQLSLKAVCAYS